jgi:hypothetical protein
MIGLTTVGFAGCKSVFHDELVAKAVRECDREHVAQFAASAKISIIELRV